jgi:hypothetical protein
MTDKQDDAQSQPGEVRLSDQLGVTVYVVESGEYEQRMIFGVFSSLDAACASIRRPYVAPYIVRWDDAAVPNSYGGYTYTGHFTRVNGYCGDRPEEWSITPYLVDADA